MRKVRLVSFLLLIVIWIVACTTSFEQRTYRTLSFSAITYDTTMKVVSDLQKQGIIDQAKRDKINGVALVFYNAYQASVDEFIKYKQNPVATNEQKVTAALNILSAAWPPFASLVNQSKAGTMAPTLEQALKERR